MTTIFVHLIRIHASLDNSLLPSQDYLYESIERSPYSVPGDSFPLLPLPCVQLVSDQVRMVVS